MSINKLNNLLFATWHPHPDDYVTLKDCMIELFKNQDYFTDSLIIEEKKSHLHAMLIIEDNFKGKCNARSLKDKLSKLLPIHTHKSNKKIRWDLINNDEKNVQETLAYVTKGEADEGEAMNNIHTDVFFKELLDHYCEEIKKIHETKGANRSKLMGSYGSDRFGEEMAALWLKDFESDPRNVEIRRQMMQHQINKVIYSLDDLSKIEDLTIWRSYVSRMIENGVRFKNLKAAVSVFYQTCHYLLAKSRKNGETECTEND